MNHRLADLPPLPAGEVAVLAEYPYYRADPAAWADNLRALKALGATVITAYVPWRWHELDPEVDGEDGYDFSGATHPQRDVLGFCRQVAEAGLVAILKPGPFIHAEVRLGGLPDRVTAMTPRRSARGAAITDEGSPTPSAHGGQFGAATADWLNAVRKEVVATVAYPQGPVIALQLGNEGVFSDLHKPIEFDDFSAPAVHAHSRWLGEQAGVPVDAAARQRWVRWTGLGTQDLLTSFRDALGDQLPVAVNLPLPGLAGSARLPESWLARAAEAVPHGALAGSTSWTGNAAFSDEALTALWLGIRFRRTDVLEDNWGFTWTDESYAHAAVPLYHALLGLAFGSSTVSVYTACTTYHWARSMAPDEAGVLREGGRPEDFVPPYCPGAPLDESGATHPNAGALRLLTGFTDWFGPVLRSAEARPAAALVVDPVAVAASAWPDESTEAAPLSTAAAAAMRWLLRDGMETDVLRPADVAVSSVDRIWSVVGGPAMARATQRALAELVAAGKPVVLVGPIPEHDEDGSPCDLLARALPGDTARHVPVTGFELPDAVEAVYATLAGDRAAGEERPLVIERYTESGVAVAYLFNRTDHEHVHTGLFAGTELTVSLAPRGVAVLIVDGAGLTGFLLNRGVLAADAAFSPVLRVSGEEVPLAQPGDLAGRRAPGGWEFRTA